MLCETRAGTAMVSVGMLTALITLWTWAIDARGPGLFYQAPTPGLEQQQQYEDDSDNDFLRRAASVEFPTPFDYEPILNICAQSDFRPGLLFTCEEQHGGIGMVRTQILTCLRYAIHAGAAVVIPSMAKRNLDDISDIETSTEVPLENMFDRQAFVERLSKGCPQMRLYNRTEDFPSYDQLAVEPLDLTGADLESDHPHDSLRYPEKWRTSFDAWLDEQQVRIHPEAPLHVRLGPSYLEYPVASDGAPFAREFGKVLSFRKDTQALAAQVLLELKKQLALPIDPSKPINENAFYGAHLRLEKDAVWAWDPEEWPFSRDEYQFQAQYDNIVRTNLSVVYVASGNRTVVDRFAEYIDRRLGEDGRNSSSTRQGLRKVKVVTKYDLLSGSARRQLDALAFDQQALVDFLIMFKASAFMGVAHSSFPWTIALRRHELSRYSGIANMGSDLLRDEYSVIMGRRADYPRVDAFDTGVWP